MKLRSIILKYKGKPTIESGSVTLEAAILLPLFIVGILTLGFSIKIIFADENIGFAASDEARVLGEEAYNIPIAPFFKNNLEKRILKENKHAAAVKVKYFSYLYSQDGVDGLISFQVTCWMESGLPLGMKRGMELKENIKCRGFIGRTAASQPFTFDEMEKNDQSNIVWIFPDGGERYHQNDCTYISSYPLQMVLNESLRSQYKPWGMSSIFSLCGILSITQKVRGSWWAREGAPQRGVWLPTH